MAKEEVPGMVKVELKIKYGSKLFTDADGAVNIHSALHPCTLREDPSKDYTFPYYEWEWETPPIDFVPAHPIPPSSDEDYYLVVPLIGGVPPVWLPYTAVVSAGCFPAYVFTWQDLMERGLV